MGQVEVKRPLFTLKSNKLLKRVQKLEEYNCFHIQLLMTTIIHELYRNNFLKTFQFNKKRKIEKKLDQGLYSG